MTVYPGDTPPEPEILEPEESSPESGKADFEWHVGQPIHFEGAAQDNEDGELPPTSLEWNSPAPSLPLRTGSSSRPSAPVLPGTRLGDADSPRPRLSLADRTDLDRGRRT